MDEARCYSRTPGWSSTAATQAQPLRGRSLPRRAHTELNCIRYNVSTRQECSSEQLKQLVVKVN